MNRMLFRQKRHVTRMQNLRSVQAFPNFDEALFTLHFSLSEPAFSAAFVR
jgi:hypothetical protein